MARASEKDQQYNEYLERRQREGFERPSSKSSGAGRSGPGRPGSQQKRDPAELLKMPDNKYTPSGYTHNASQLGSDPLSSVRTLRNNMRNMSSRYRDSDLPVKAHLCDAACNELSKAEGEIMALQRQRSNAIMTGDAAEAEKYKAKMEQVAERAIHNTNADLIIDNNQMNAFGVDSKWAPPPAPLQADAHPVPPPQPPPKTPTKSAERAPTDGPFNPRGGRGQRAKEDAKRPDSRRPDSRRRDTPTRGSDSKRPETKRPDSRRRAQSSGSNRPPPQNAPTEFDPEIKKNERLANVMGWGKNSPARVLASNTNDDPYQPMNYYGKCPHCGEGADDFRKPGREAAHYKNDCKVMNRCRYCDKVIMISELTDHYINRCEFLEGAMEPCRDCGMATQSRDQASGISHPMCRRRKAPDGAMWCPLCAVAVDDQPDKWRDHVINKCFNNMRRGGFDQKTFPKPESKPSDKHDAGSGSSAPKSSNPNGLPTQPPPGPPAPMPGARKPSPQQLANNGRMIDADKLVAALQAIQAEKKKKASKKAPAAEPTEAAPAAAPTDASAPAAAPAAAPAPAATAPAAK